MGDLLAIKDAADQAGLRPGTLRLYDRLGLLQPARDSLGRRLYTAQDVTRARALYVERVARKARAFCRKA